MKTIGKLRIILTLAAILFTLMVYKTLQTGAWKGRADEAVRGVETGECFIDLTGLRESKEPVLLLRFGKTGSDSLLHSMAFRERQMAIRDLAGRAIQKELRASAGRQVIVASTRAEAMKAWILLHQLGMKNIYIFSGGEGYDESLKQRFRPEDEFRPEPENREN